MSVYENIAVVPNLLKWDKRKTKNRVLSLMEMVNLPSDFLEKYPDQLSGGQRQRVGVARGLAADPRILLMDEPFGAIDPINRERLQDSFLEIQRDIRKTVLFVTHDIREALKLGDRIAIMDKGKLVQYDETLKVVRKPANNFVENLLGADRALKELEVQRVQDNFEADFRSLTIGGSIDPGILRAQFTGTKEHTIMALDGKGKLLGYLRQEDLALVSPESDPQSLVRPIEPTRLYATLMEAITLMLSSGHTTVPVVDEREKVLGIIRFRKIFGKLEEMAVSLRE